MASWRPITAQPLTSQRVLKELLKTQLTPRGGITRGSSRICVCYEWAVGGGSGANSLLALSRNQEAVTPNPCGRRRPRQDLSGE